MSRDGKDGSLLQRPCTAPSPPPPAALRRMESSEDDSDESTEEEATEYESSSEYTTDSDSETEYPEQVSGHLAATLSTGEWSSGCHSVNR